MSIWSRADAAIAFQNPWRERPLSARRRRAARCVQTGLLAGVVYPWCRCTRGTAGVQYPAGDGRVPAVPSNPAVRPTAARRRSSAEHEGEAWHRPRRPAAGQPLEDRTYLADWE